MNIPVKDERKAEFFKGGIPMDAKKIESYTAEDYFNLPENTRVELIDGVFYDMASPSLNHQLIVSELNRQIGNHIKEKGGPCKVLPAPFTVKLYDDVVVVRPEKADGKGL